MIRFSYIVIDHLTSFGSDAAVRDMLASLKEMGYEGVEINLTEPLGVNLDVLEAWLDELGLVIPSFLTGEAYNDGLCLSSPIAELRSGAVKRLVSYLNVAKRFNAILVVGLLQGLRSDESDPEVANTRIADGLQQVAAVAENMGVEFVIEPVNHLQVGFNNSVAEVIDLIDRIGSPSVRPMVDTVHMNIEEISLTEPIRRCGNSLRHVHLCESNGALFGSGCVDFAAVFQALDDVGYDGFASVKVYRSPLLEGAQTSIKHLSELRGGPGS